MAYAAVASLLQTIHLTLNYHHPSISPEFLNQIMPIHQHTCSLRSFMEGSSHRVYNWEETIREVTSRAEDIIELLLSDSLLEPSGGSSRSELERGKCEVRYGLNELEKVREDIESIASRVKGGKRIEAPVGDGGFSCLIFLLIEGSNLRRWITKSGYFPRLGRLELVRCSSLLEVPYEMPEIPTLEDIFLGDTNQSLRRSAEQIQLDRLSLGHDPVYVCVEYKFDCSQNTIWNLQ